MPVFLLYQYLRNKMKYTAEVVKMLLFLYGGAKKNHPSSRDFSSNCEYVTKSRTVLSCCGISYFAAVMLCFVCFTHDLPATEKQSVLETIQKFDDVYEKGVSTSGRYVSIIPPIFRGRTRDKVTDYRWHYTQSGLNRAALEVSNIVAGINEDGSAMLHRQFWLFDQKRSGKKMVLLSPVVPIQEYADSQAVADVTLDLHAPNSDTLSFQMDKFLFAIGRGVSRKIVFGDDTKVELVERNDESCVFITGIGDYMSGRGIWEFYVLADAAYMLRYARFFRGGVMLEIETFGLNKNNDCFSPEKTEIRIPLGSTSLDQTAIVHSFEFTSVGLEFDSGLFERVVREFDEELPDGSLKMDSSSGKDVVQVIGGEEPREPYTLEPRPLGRRLFFIVGFNLLGIALLIYLIRRDQRRKREQDTASHSNKSP